jgi:acyl-CoA thioester hydrolase
MTGEPDGILEHLRAIREKLGDHDGRIVWATDVLRFCDTDALGHVNNSVFSVLCESGRVRLFRTRLDPTLPFAGFWVIARLAIEFRAELHYPGEVRTGTWPTRLGRSSLTLEQVLVSSNGLTATAESVCVLMDAATRRSTPLPDATRRAVEALLRPPASLDD